MKLTKTLVAVVAVMASALSSAAQDRVAQTPQQTDSLSRAAATLMAKAIDGSLKNIEGLGVTIDRDIFTQTIADALAGRPTGFTAEAADGYIDAYVQRLHPQAPDTVSAESQRAFVEEMAAREGAVTTPSGLVFIVEKEGEGAFPADSDIVTVDYVGQLSDGTVFDKTDGTPAQFNVNKLIPGFTEGLKMMRPGGTYRLIIPYNLAYGEKGISGIIPGYSTLDFTVTLRGISPGGGK